VRFRHLGAVSILAAGLVGACGSDSKKKHPAGDASAAEGSVSGGGAGGADAAPDVTADAAPDVTADAAPDVGDAAPDVIDAMPDAGDAAPDVIDAMPDVFTCGAGTVNLVAGGCIACPADGGTPEAGAADSGTGGTTGEAGVDGGDPYNPYLTCKTLANAPTGYDPATHILTVNADYPLELDSVDYNIDLAVKNTSTGAVTFPTITGSLPLVGNTLSLDLSSAVGSGFSIVSVTINQLDAHDACGRTSSYVHFDCQNQPDEILFGPGDGGVWTASCGPNC
jgi:hypothetical protein